MSKNLKIKLLAALFILLIIIIVGLSFYLLPVSKIALALSSNYSKATGGQLSATDWNNLPNDFVAKSGDTMTGPLVLSGDPLQNLQAATKQYVDIASIKDLAGNRLKIICGNTTPGFTNWQTYSYNLHSLYVDVDTTSAGFTQNDVRYFSYILGSYSYLTTGTSVIYSPAATSFRMYANFLGENNDFKVPLIYGGGLITPTLANDPFQWTVYWCGIGR